MKPQFFLPRSPTPSVHGGRTEINKHVTPGRNAPWDLYQVTGWCVSLVSCSPERDFSVSLLTATPRRVMLNERTWNLVNQLKLVRNNVWVDTLQLLLAQRQNSNSHEPAAWHALGCATSPSCHLQHIKPSVDCRNLCPLQSICRPNLGGLINWTFVLGSIDKWCFHHVIALASLWEYDERMCGNVQYLLVLRYNKRTKQWLPSASCILQGCWVLEILIGC